jgi:uncharacterized protein YhbP (UPF0306 family)
MSKVSYRKFIDEYMAKGKIMQLATVGDNGPWICTVNYANDADGNIYWMSMRRTRHSVEVEQNTRAAVAIVLDPERKMGLQLTGRASRVDDDNLEQVHNLYSAKYGGKPERLAEARSASLDVRTYYVFRPDSAKMHDQVNFPTGPQQFVDMNS